MGSKRRKRALCSALVLSAFSWGFTVGAAAFGQPPDEPLDVTARSDVTLNQGVAIERRTAETKSTAAPSGEGTLTTDAAARDTDGGAAAPGDARLVRRRVRRENARPSKRPTWYGSGLWPLVGVLVLIGSAAWVVRRWVPAARAHDGGVIKVVARANVTAKHSVALVQLGRRMILVGACGDRLSMLSEITEAEEVAELAARVGGGALEAFDGLLGDESAAYMETPSNESDDRRVKERGATVMPEPVDRLLSKLRAMKTS